jgi:hypothetical protein
MSLLRPEDAPLHYSDGAHRWIGSDLELDEAWQAQLRAHMEAHRQFPEDGYTLRRPPTSRPRDEARRGRR